MNIRRFCFQGRLKISYGATVRLHFLYSSCMYLLRLAMWAIMNGRHLHGQCFAKQLAFHFYYRWGEGEEEGEREEDEREEEERNRRGERGAEREEGREALSNVAYS